MLLITFYCLAQLLVQEIYFNQAIVAPPLTFLLNFTIRIVSKIFTELNLFIEYVHVHCYINKQTSRNASNILHKFLNDIQAKVLYRRSKVDFKFIDRSHIIDCIKSSLIEKIKIHVIPS